MPQTAAPRQAEPQAAEPSPPSVSHTHRRKQLLPPQASHMSRKTWPCRLLRSLPNLAVTARITAIPGSASRRKQYNTHLSDSRQVGYSTHLRPPLTAFLLAASALLPACRSTPPRRELVVYISVDQIHAEPVLRAFERRTSINVRPVFDVEASKATGLASRIVAERSRPQADVFWNSEFVQTLRLHQEGMLQAAHPRGADTLPTHLKDPHDHWFAVGARFRVILINARKLTAAQAPTTWQDFASNRFPAAELAISQPLFGTAAAQAAALYASLGAEPARALYNTIHDRGVLIVDGNSVVRDLVARGDVSAGWTDSDDACVALANHSPVEIILPDQNVQGTLLIPGTVAQLAGAPHPLEALAFLEFLLEPATEQLLIDSGFFQMSVRPGGPIHPCLGQRPVRAMTLPLHRIDAQIEPSRRDITAIFGQ